MSPRLRDGIIGLSVFGVAFSLIWVLGTLNSALQSGRNGLVALPQTIQDADSAVKHVSAVADGLGGVISQERIAQSSQLRESAKIMAAAKEVIVRTDCQLNGGPGCRGLLPQATTTLEDSAQQIQLLAKSGQDTLQSASFLLNSANRRINDQRLDSIVDSFQIAALHFGQSSEHVDQTTADLEAVADHYRQVLLTKRGFWKTVGLGAFHLITPATNVAIALK